MPPNAVWGPQGSDSPLTAADLVGRAFRIIRLNWKETLLPFLVPALINGMCQEAIYWVPMHLWSGYADELMAGISVFALLGMMLSRYLLGVRTLAVQYFLFGMAKDLRSALQMADKKRVAALVIVLPLIVADTLSVGLASTSLGILEAAEKRLSPLPEGVGEIVGVLLMGLYVLLLFPYGAFCLLNGMFSAGYIREKRSILSAARRFFSLAFKALPFILAYVVIGILVYAVLAFPSSIFELIEVIPEFAGENIKPVLEIVCAVITGILNAPLGTVWYASLAAAGVTLYQHLTIELEGADLTERLKVLQEKI